nr:SGNH/GDSL hydrolase family protein [Elizabethkingia sp. ASV34]
MDNNNNLLPFVKPIPIGQVPENNNPSPNASLLYGNYVNGNPELEANRMSIQYFNDKINTGYNDTMSNSLTIPGSGYFRYKVIYAGKYTNVTPNIEVSTEDLKNNYVVISVRDGVALKELDPKPDSDFDPTYGIDPETLSKTNEINPDKSVWSASGSLDSRGHNAWFKGVSEKKINMIAVPIVHANGGQLTGGVNIMIGLNNNWIFKTVIPFSVIEKYNSINIPSASPDEFLCYVSIPEITINTNDILFVGIYTDVPADKLGFYYTQNLKDEWVDGGYSQNSDGTDYTTPPAKVDNPNVYSFQFYYSESFFSKAVENSVTPLLLSDKEYFSKDLLRQNIGVFLEKLRLKQSVKVVHYGNSITQFQNSETLTETEQKTAPLGLTSNSWVRQLWKKLKYYEEDVQYRRFDHSDFSFSNGIQSTSASIGSNGWATTRNDSTDSWRDNIFNTGFPQAIFSGSSFSKPLVGTNKSGQSFTITIPAFATEVNIYTNTNYNNQTIGVKINNGTSDIVNENKNINDGNNPVENIIRYTFASGTSKILTITTLDTNPVFFWGISYASKPYVRSVNSGMGGYNIQLLSDANRFNEQVGKHNPDLVVFEVCSSNDRFLNITLSEHQALVKSLMDKLKSLNVPVIVLLAHRFTTQKLNRNETPINVQNSVEFMPELIKNYRSSASKNGFGIIDLWSKSVDILGNTNTITPPNGFFVDEGHLGVGGNKMYFEELDKAFFKDFE